MENEKDYRQRIQKLFDQIELSFDGIDPDVAECEQAMGALVISFPDRSKVILSAQPSVRQLWLALAALGTAYHFNYDQNQKAWIDDKGKGIELTTFLMGYLTEKAGVAVRF